MALERKDKNIMNTFNKSMVAVLMCATLLFTGCANKKVAVNAPTATPLTTQQKLVRDANILANVTKAAVQVTQDLNAAGTLTDAQTAEVMAYEQKVLDATTSLSAILATNASFQTELPLLVKVVTSLPPDSLVQKYLKMNSTQYAAFAAALQTVTTTVQLVTLEVQQ